MGWRGRLSAFAAHPLGMVLMWAVLPGLTTSTVASVGRALCLPPYWPDRYALRCRPEGYGAATTQALLETAVSGVMIALPSAAVGGGVWVIARICRRILPLQATRAAAALIGAMVWILLARSLESSYLDFILGGYAIAAGAMVAGGVAGSSVSP
jgi:hypothetical protein